MRKQVTINISICNILMVLHALQGTDYRQLRPLITRIEAGLESLPEDTLPSHIVAVDIFLDEVDFVYSVLKNQTEHLYNRVNSDLADELMRLAQTDADLAAYLIAKEGARDEAKKKFQQAALSFIDNLPQGVIAYYNT